jgi:hypothetical protein
MPVEVEPAVTVANGIIHHIDSYEVTGGPKSHGFAGPATGDATFSEGFVVAPGQKIPRRPAHQGKNRPAQPLPSSETRRAIRMHWNEAQEAAERMRQAAEDKDLMAVGIAADQFDQRLAELWKLRDARDVNWQTILNHVQGLMRVFFQEKRAETLTTAECTRLVDLVRDHLGPATKTVDDLNEALRLIEDAGFDPYAAISGDPGSPEEE